MAMKPLQIIILLVLSSLNPFMCFEINADIETEALLKWKSTLYQPTSLSSWSLTNSTTHCKWYGILCNDDGSIVALELANSDLVGTLDHLDFSSLRNLTTLNLNSNNLTGSIPSNLGKNGLLEFVDFSLNYFSDELPQALCSNFALQMLRVTSNNLMGRLPSCLRSLAGLVDVFLDDNYFIGDLSEAFGVHPSIEFLILSNNNFNGSIPESFCSMKKLKYLMVADNSLSGSLPDCWSDLKAISILDLVHNKLFGEIPRSFGSMFSLEMLSLNNNYLAGEVPSTLQNCKMLVKVNMEENELYGNIPSWFDGSSTPLISFLELGSNNFNGNIPESICELKNLRMLNLSGNHLIGNLPNCWTKIGKLPWSLQRCKNLITLDLRENGFTGDIPIWFGRSFPLLRNVSLRSNRLSGSIPTQLSLLASLQFLDLANNNLTGYIPTSFSHLVAMTKQEGYPNATSAVTEMSNLAMMDYFGGILVEWHKRDQEFKSEVYLLNGIDLSNNSLSGQIPKELTLLSGLRLLNLSTNRLFGTIPEAVDKLQSLESLDLSNNQLSGTIPPSMFSLSSLDFLNVSNNNLSGSIPKGTQLQTFDPSAYSGNMELCGAPLNKKCPTEESSDHQASTQDNRSQNEDTEEMVWFYLSVVLGIIVGFWVFCGILIFKKKWRIIYFQFIDNLPDRICKK